MKHILIALITALLPVAAMAGIAPTPPLMPMYIGPPGPCDIVTCAEAYSVIRPMKAAYTGPLFQLYNGSTTLDIGQFNHRADLSTWSSFCSGVPALCVVSKIYAQINSANNLVPVTHDAGVCGGVGNTACAGWFSIDQNTGAPFFYTGLNKAAFAVKYYVGTPGSDDTASTGITAGANPLSIVYSGISDRKAHCCGTFGLTHKYNVATTAGTDYMAILQWGTAGFANSICSTSTTFCAGTENEQNADVADYTSPSGGRNVILGVTNDPTGSQRITGYLDGSQLFSHSPPQYQTANPGNFIHFGGGGDLTGYAGSVFREAIITNSTLSSAQYTLVYNNMLPFTLRTAALPSSGYIGPGDQVPGATAYYGVRAYKQSVIGSAAINLRRASDSHTCDILLATNGGLGNTANCSTGGDNAQSVSSFCNATSCFETKLYDQTGNGNNLTQVTPANQPGINLSCVNSLPCMTFAGSQFLSGPGIITAVPTLHVIFAERTGNTAAFNTVFSPGGGTVDLGFSNSVNLVDAFYGLSTTVAATDNQWHSSIILPCVNFFIVDGLHNDNNPGCSTTGAPGTAGFGASGIGGNSFVGNATEGVFYDGQVHTEIDALAICHNQSQYWATPSC